MRTTVLRAAASLLSLSLFTACPTAPVECIEGDEEVCDAGALPPDFCDSPEEARADSTNCHLEVGAGTAPLPRKQGVFISRLGDGGADRDWYFAQLPALTARSLLHVNSGYQVPQTAVNLTLNVLKEASDGGYASVATGVDRHGAAAPKPVDLVVPFSESNAKLFLLVSDEGGAQVRVDNRNPYSVGVEVLDNPDVNEPNDTAPTAITLAAQGAISQGQQTGYLATNDDVDLYSFPVTQAGRQIIYLRITGPNPPPARPPPFRLAYTLYDPGDRPISEGAMDNAFLAIDLKTARLAPMTGTYKVKVSGYREPNSNAVIPGDLDLQYQVAVQLLPDLDTQEPNDAAATARAVTLTPNASRSITGKIAYVADEEWFALSLPARSSPSTLRYRLSVAGSGGRFEPLSGVPTRQLRVFTKVTTGATAQDRRQNCRANATLCPKGYDDPTSDQADLVGSLCDSFDPPLCLWAQRNEEPQFAMLKNHVGAVPVKANQAQEFLLMLRDERLYADDRDWTIEVDWRDDADEASRAGGPTVVGLSGSTATATGELTFGHGRILDPFDVNTGRGIRAPVDYDAFATDEDLFRFDFGGVTGDQGWELSWELQHPDGGTAPPGDISLELTFCQGGPAPDGGLCTGAQRRILAYSDERLTPWYQPMSFSNAQVLFSRSSTATTTTITALPVGCWCFAADRTAAGSFYASVVGVNRTANDPLRYQLRQRLTAYPGAYSTPDGGGGTCPVADGGCGFAR